MIISAPELDIQATHLTYDILVYPWIEVNFYLILSH